MTYLSAAQHAQLLAAINPRRVNKNRDGYSHVEAYEIRAHLNRVFGFGRWSADTLVMEPLFEVIGDIEREKKDGSKYTVTVVTVAYRAQVRLTVCAPDGTELATYTEWASGDAQNFPVSKRGDAHDFAIKTAESQAFKRAATNLGDNFGLSLYNSGSTSPLVKRTLVVVEGEAAAHEDRVDSHVQQVTPENQPPDEREPEPDPRERTEPPAAVDSEAEQAAHIAAAIREAALNMPDGENPHKWLAKQQAAAMKAGVLGVMVTSASGGQQTLKALIDDCLRGAQGKVP